MKSVEFSYKLLDKVKVAVVPGLAYGASGDDYVRIAFTQSEDKISEAVERIKKFVLTCEEQDEQQ
jgi:aspartate/methionine/tyrosine aminotransferase